MVAVHTLQATEAISARSDQRYLDKSRAVLPRVHVDGPFIDFVHCTVYHKSHVGSRIFISCSKQYINPLTGEFIFTAYDVHFKNS